MTVTSNTTRNDYVAGTNQNVYNYTFQLNEGSDVTVYLGGVVQTRNVHYTVQDLGVGTGGTITFTLVDSGGNPIYPTPGTIISILMTMELDRDTDYQPNGVFLASEVNNDYDRLWLATNQQQTAINRSLRLQDDDIAGASPSMELPLKDDRKGKILSFDSVTGEPITAIPAEYEIPTLAETLAEGNTTGGNDIVHDTNDKAVFGTGAVGSVLELYSDGTGSGRIENVGPGSMVLKAPDFVFRNDSDQGILALYQSRSASFTDNTGNTRMSVGNGRVTIHDEARVEGTVTFDDLGRNGAGAVLVNDILDEDNMASDSATALATQQSIKAYVDSQVGTVDTLSEVLANGNTTGGNDIAFGDNDKATFGANTDLEIYSDASSSFINELGPGGLVVQGANVNIKNSSGQRIAEFTNARSSIFYDSGGIDRLTVRSGGITVDGQARINGEVLFDSIQRNGINAVVIDDILDEDNMASDSATALATQQSIKAYVDSQSSSDSLSTILGNGNTTGGNDIVYTTNDKAVFGTGAVGSALEIYTDGTGSGRIENVGAGSMILKAPNFVFRNDSDQSILALYQNRSASFKDNTGNTRMSVGAGKVVINDEARVYGSLRFDELATNTALDPGGSGGPIIDEIFDEDDMASDSATGLATQQSIKAYVDASAGTTYTAGTGITLTGTEFSIGQPVATTDNVEFVDILATGRITVGNVTNNSTRSAVIGDNCTNAGYGALVVGMEHQNDGDLNLISGYDNDCGSGATLNAISGANHTVTGDNNLVAGNLNSALSSFGLVSGYKTSIQASADNSFVGGYECEARGTNSFAFGSTWANVKVRAYGINSFALGGGNMTHTNANNSMAIGALCEVGQTSPPAGRSANQGFAMGYECKVYENNGMAGGNDSLCFSDGGMAFGYGATASDAEANFAFGKGVTTPVTSGTGNAVGQVVVGQWNQWQNTIPHLFAVGCGQSDTNRATAFVVKKNMGATTALVGVNMLNPVYNLQVNGNAAKSSGIYWTNTSDERTKENIREYDKGLDEICQLNTKLYDFNGKGQTEVSQDNVGVIAQDVLPIFPEAIGTYEAKLNEEDAEDTEIYNIDMQPITFAMINAIKDLKAENDALKARLDAAGL